MDNIDNFNKYTAVCLAKLYKNFPISVSLLANDLVPVVIGESQCFEPDITANVANEVQEGFIQKTELFNSHIEIANATVKWLENCGYIMNTGGTLNSGVLYVLSPKGLEVLSAIPDSLQAESESFGQKLIKASDNVAGETGKALLSKTIGEIVGHAFKAGLGM